MNSLPFSFDKPENSPGFLLWQTTMIWQRQIKRVLEPYNISHAQFVIMATLIWSHAYRYDTTQIAIVNQTKLDKMTVSKSLKKLVAVGFVNRIEHKNDTRAKSVTLTAKGKKLVAKLVPIIEEVDAQFFGMITKQQEKDLITLLTKLIQTTNDLIDSAHKKLYKK